MEKLEKFKSLNQSEMKNIFGGDFVHTSFDMFGMGVQDVFDDSNGNGVADEGEAFVLAQVNPD